MATRNYIKIIIYKYIAYEIYVKICIYYEFIVLMLTKY